MAEVIWTDCAVADLNSIAEYIAIDDIGAASKLVKKIYRRVGQLQSQPNLGSVPKELKQIKKYRQIVEPPCRVIYRKDGETVYIVHVLRGEQLLRRRNLTRKS